MMQYLSMVRLEKARELLLGKEIEVREAAALVGYSDEYYFSRCFKKLLWGITFTGETFKVKGQ